MVRRPDLSELLQLSAAERLQLAQDLWDSVADDAAAWSLSDEQRRVLEQRLGAYQQTPDAGTDWQTVKQRIERRA